MTFVKLPTKGEGVTAVVNGNPVICKGSDYNGTTQYKWFYQENGNPVYRKINGTIQVVAPDFKGDVGNTTSTQSVVVFPEVNSTFEQAHADAIEKEAQFTGLAVKIATARYPDLNQDSGTFGMIVNAIKTHLINLA